MTAMPPRTLGSRGPAAPASQQQTNTAPQPPRGSSTPAPSQARGGLPPLPSNWTPPSPGGLTKRTDKEWDADPLAAGEHEFDAYVSKIVAWNAGGVTVTFRVSQWDREANRSGPQHGRPIRFDQQPRRAVLDAYLSDPNDEQAAKKYAYWRHDIVTAYTASGYPEDQWQRDAVGPVPPWDRFFVIAAGGLSVPVMFRLKVRAWRGTTASGVDVKSMSMIKTSDGRPFQAPLPREVPPGLATLHRWTVVETRVAGDNLATCAVLDKDCVPFPFNNMPTYKDL